MTFENVPRPNVKGLGILPPEWQVHRVENLERCGAVYLGRGEVISRKDLTETPGTYPVCSSSTQQSGLFGRYGKYMFDEELVTWSIDGGGNFFYRPKHKFSVTNVCGYLRLDTKRFNYRFIASLLELQHRALVFDYQSKAHPSVARKLYSFVEPPLKEQIAIVDLLSSIDKALEASKAVLEQLRALFLNVRDVLVLRGMAKRHHSYKTAKGIGPIPQTWNIHLLSGCATVQTGVAKGKKYKNGKIVSLPYLRVANVQDGYLDLTEIKQIGVLEDEVKRYALRYGDVLLTEGGDYDKLGRGHMWRGEITPCLHQNHVFSVRANKSLLLPEYLNHITSSSYGKRYFLNNSKQTTNLASINSTQLKSLPCPLPSIKEQAEIIEVLDSIQQNVLLEQAKLEVLASAKKGLSKQLLTGKLRMAVNDG